MAPQVQHRQVVREAVAHKDPALGDLSDSRLDLPHWWCSLEVLRSATGNERPPKKGDISVRIAADESNNQMPGF